MPLHLLASGPPLQGLRLLASRPPMELLQGLRLLPTPVSLTLFRLTKNLSYLKLKLFCCNYNQHYIVLNLLIIQFFHEEAHHPFDVDV